MNIYNKKFKLTGQFLSLPYCMYLQADINQHAPAFHHSDSDIEVEYTDKLFHNAVIIEFVLCTGVAVALLLLILWHIRMISVGETNVEVHINKKEKKRLKKKGLVCN